MKNLNLESFQFTSKENGWKSPLIEFADGITAFEGPNGSGKTPLMNGIAYAFGLSVSLPVDIVEKCQFAILNLKMLDNVLTLKRKIGGEDFHLEVFENDVKIEEFKGYGSIGKYSKFFLKLMDIRDIEVMSVGSKEKRSPISLYISTIIPIFYLSQAKGFLKHYSPLEKQSFINNQYEEVIRAVFNLPALSPASIEEEKDVFYKKRDRVKSSINELEKKVDFFKQRLGKKLGLSLADIEKFRDQFSNRVQDIHQGLLVTGGNSENTINEEITSFRQELTVINSTISQIKFKLRGLESLESDIQKKINIEEDTYDAEVAFQRFCSQQECSLFANKKVPFGKKILYLRDQLKDITKAIIQYKDEQQVLEEQKNSINTKIEKEIIKPRSSTENFGRNLELLKENIGNLAEYSEAFKNKESLDSYSELLSSEQINLTQVTETIQLFKGKGSKINERHAEIKNTFEGLLKEWLDTVSTPNIRKHPIEIDGNFNIFFRGIQFETDSEQDGSTRVRIVLAYHAALLETSLKFNANHPGFIMIDTPKKEEIRMEDLVSYFSRMRTLKDTYKKKIQIIIAYKDPFLDLNKRTDKKYEPNVDVFEDGEWVKKYLGA